MTVTIGVGIKVTLALLEEWIEYTGLVVDVGNEASTATVAWSLSTGSSSS